MFNALELTPLFLGAVAHGCLCLALLLRGKAPALAWWFVPVYYVLFLLGLASGFAPLAYRMGLSAETAMVSSGAARTLAYSSIPALLIYLGLRFGSWLLVPKSFHPARRRFLDAAGAVLVASPLIAAGYGILVQRRNFQVRETDVPVPDLPADLEGLRLIHLSDIHLSPFLTESELAGVVDASNELRSHVAAVTGDLISSPGDPLNACLRQLARLRPDTAILACLGNHEGFARVKGHARAEGARLGVEFLVAQTRALRFGSATVNFAGVDYEPVSRRGRYLRGAERLVVPGAFNVLLSHNPDVFPEAARKGYHLVLSGHTHGGQVNIEILDQGINPARFLTPFVYGLYREGPAAAYVTRGIGTIGIPARIGAPPEISLLRLRKA